MSRKKQRIKYPIIVEGKYDKIKLASLFDARIITTDGFGVFSNEDKKKLFVSLSKTTPLIIATDSDGAGLVIRNFFKGIIQQDRLYHIYIPSIKGKESRKSEPSKEGTLGLEGIDADCLVALFEPFFEQSDITAEKRESLTRTDLYELGLSGGQNSRSKREYLCRALSLPENISSQALLDVLNILYTRDHVIRLMEKYSVTAE